jgi:hypothetical protein
MAGERAAPVRGRVLWFGRARITQGETESERPAAVVEFEDTAAMAYALNSGFADLDFADDTLAVVLDRKPPGT